MKPSKNNLTQNDVGDVNGMPETKNELIKTECENIIPIYSRKCPKCNTTIPYKRCWDCNRAEKTGGLCKKCSAKIRNDKYNYKEKFSGIKNPMYGRRHTDETRQIMSKVDRSYMTGSNNPMKNEATRKYFSELFSGENNPMYGTHLSDERKQEYSIKFSGKGNPMYGKPTPQGSGNGWACWYKGHHFRSLRELQYYIVELDGHCVFCESAEGNKFKIPYKDYLGNDRTYRPDFFVDGKILVEIKPKKLWNTREVIAKKIAAEEFCSKNGYEYKLVDIILDSKLLKEKYLNGEIKFVEKYKERFEKYAGIK